MTQSPPDSKASSTQPLLLLCIGWAILSLLFFLLFGALVPGEESRPNWFLISITFIEIFGFLLATVLCFRNFGSSQIISGRTVWLSLGIAMLAYAAGNVFFFLWGTVWGLDPSVSLGDGFYFISYVCMVVGMLLAALPRRIDLSVSQWMMILAIGVGGVLLALAINFGLPGLAQVPGINQPAVAADMLMSQAPPPDPAAAPEAAPEAPTAAPAEPETAAPEEPPAAVEEAETVAGLMPAPAWAQTLDANLEKYAEPVGLMYVIADCFLVVIAATLLVAFWGGRFSQSWKLIAIATFCLYLADIAFAAAGDNYVEGALWEVFWVWSSLFFALGAIVEYDVSKRSRRGSRRRA